ncbi:hypothetical protein ABF87_13835 [Nitrosomonas sp. JL21]|nr:hypothetical protein [Nitrosomonas sp. JL21]
MSESGIIPISHHSLNSPLMGKEGKFVSYGINRSNKIKMSGRVLLSMALLMSNISFAELIFPSGLTNKLGSASSQPLEVLAVKDQQATDDNATKYIEFHPSAAGYVGRFNFTVPASPNTTVDKLVLRANYRGQEATAQKWTFQLLEVNTGKWVDIANNSNAANWHWSNITSTITTPEKFINSKNRVTLRYITYSKDTDMSQLDYMALQVTRSATTPPPPDPDPGTPPSTGADWKPIPGLKWHIQYTGTLNTALNVDVYNIDLFDTSAATISTLRSKGKHVICYFSAGSYENWRPDTNKFPASVLGRDLDGWPGEKWLDVRKLDILVPIMRARMKMAADKGCHAVDPDNVDGYSNNTGFALSYNDQLAYNVALTEAAHDLGLAIGLKNNLDQIKDLVNHYDFAVNEECYQYDECNLLKPFVAAGKPVFGIEYNLSSSSFCPKANASNFDFQKKRLSLDAWVEACR